MKSKRLLNADELEDSTVVANCTMNRERDLRGSNGYEVEVGFDPLEWLQERLARQSTVRWLDLCCGSGKALIQAAKLCECGREIVSESGRENGRESGSGGRVRITGVDLVGMFLPNQSIHLQLIQSSVFDYQPIERFDLITCVHGLHYLGDKLQAIRLAASWLVSDGCFVANLDAANLCVLEAGKGQRKIVRFLRDEGFEYLPAKHLLKCTGYSELSVRFKFLGADDTAGPNYTKQPAVNSYYE